MLMLIACSPEGAGASCARSACNAPATAGALPMSHDRVDRD